MINILNLTKLEERQFYDSLWSVETNQGNIELHQYDDVKECELRKDIEMCNNLEEIKRLEPESFYFD
jgi:hypothetical protein